MDLAGYAALFLSAFLAATILPLSSEAVLAALTATEGPHVLLLVAVATAGNTAGALVNWLLGRFCLYWRERKWFPVKPEPLARATRWFQHYGSWTLLFAWLPVVGDPLTLVAGILRVNIWLFLALVASGKVARYFVVALMAQGFFG